MKNCKNKEIKTATYRSYYTLILSAAAACCTICGKSETQAHINTTNFLPFSFVVVMEMTILRSRPSLITTTQIGS